MLRYGLYARKSDDDRSVTEKSIGEQVAACEQLARDQNLVIVRRWEESKSAKMPGIRSGYQELVAAVEAGEIDGILCWHINRLVRNMKEGGELVQLLVDRKVREIRTPHSNYQPEDNILPIVIEAASATQYSRDLSNTVKRSMTGNFERGNCNYRAPQGYKNARSEFNLKRGTIEKDEERFGKIRKAWDLMLTGRSSVTEVINYLNNELDYRTRLTKLGGGKPLTVSAGYAIFRNPFYMGFVRYNGKMLMGNHEPMVSPEEFTFVQSILGAETKKCSHSQFHSYTGLMRCKHCGYQITADRKLLRNGTFWTSYRCSDPTLTCSKKGIDAAAVTKKIAAVLSQLTIDPRYVPICLEVISASLQKLDPDSVSNEQIERELRSVEERLANLEEMGLAGLIRDHKRYRELQDTELKKRQDLIVERERVSSEVALMKQNAKRVLTYAAFAERSFVNASSEHQGQIAAMLASVYEFDGVAKAINIVVKPILSEIVRFVKQQISPIEPAILGSGKQKEPAFARSFHFGGPNLGRIEVPDSLLRELRGELFPEFPIHLELSEGPSHGGRT